MYTHITYNPQILGGKPHIQGTRLSVEFFMELLASGGSVEDIQNESTLIDARSLKKIKMILSLPKSQRHITYTMAESILKQNAEKNNQEVCMNRVQKIESEVQTLSPSEFKQLRNWLDDYEHKMWDKQLQQDIQAGKLDALADEALSQFDSGKYKEV